jgi:hypothetical protein
MTTEAQEIRTNVDAYLKQIGVSYSAEFVPQRLSRNSDNKDKSINWRVMFHHDKRDTEFGTDYSQGIGHIPNYVSSPFNGQFRLLQLDQEKLASSEGLYPVVTEWHEFAFKMRDDQPATIKEPKHWHKQKKLPCPTAADVLYCLVLDAQASDELFETWADNFGYDQDSRKAEAMYNECRKIAYEMRKVFTPAQIDHIAELVREL